MDEFAEEDNVEASKLEKKERKNMPEDFSRACTISSRAEFKYDLGNVTV